MPRTAKVDVNDKCTCKKPKPVVINYDCDWQDGHVICDRKEKGCGKFIKMYEGVNDG